MSSLCPTIWCEVPTGDGGLCTTCSADLQSALRRVGTSLTELDTTRARLRSTWSAALPDKPGRRRVTAETTALMYDHRAASVHRTLVQLVASWLAALTTDGVVDERAIANPHAAAAVLAAAGADLRVHPAAGDALEELKGAVDAAERVIDRSDERAEVGLCDGCGDRLRALPGAAFVRCRSCDVGYDVHDRRERLLELAADRLVTAAEAAPILTTWSGRRCTSAQVRGWRYRGLLKQHGTADRYASPLYRLGDVADLLLEQREHPIRRSA